MTTAAYHRHDISDPRWEILVPLLSGGAGKAGRPARNNRRFTNAVFRVLGAAVPRRDLPPSPQTTDTGVLLTIASATGRGRAYLEVAAGGGMAGSWTRLGAVGGLRGRRWGIWRWG